MEWTVQDGEVRRPVTAKSAPGDAKAEGRRRRRAQRGGRRERGRRHGRRRAERERTAGSASSRVTKRRGQRLRRAVGAAVKRHAMIVITDTLPGVVAVGVVTGTGQDIAVMVSRVVNMNGVTGNDDDAKPAPTTRTWTATPASRAVVGRLARRRSSSSSAAPGLDGVMRGVLTEPTAEVRSVAPEARAVVQTPVHGKSAEASDGRSAHRRGESGTGRAHDERSEADGMSGAMPPEAASRGDVGT